MSAPLTVLDDDEKQPESIDKLSNPPDDDPVHSHRAQSISAYFTIAAAAFGLISDGCE
jgi:hypothetical protein